jgi:hypothetical protein
MTPTGGWVDEIGFWQTSDGALVRTIAAPADSDVLYSAVGVGGRWSAVIAPVTGGDGGRRLLTGDDTGDVGNDRAVDFFGALSFSPDGARLLMSPPLGGTLPGAPAVIVYDAVTTDEVARHDFGVDAF